MIAKTVFIQGPMHPDLFGGETSIMMEVPTRQAGKVFTVEIEASYTERADRTMAVMALDEKMATDQVMEYLRDDLSACEDLELLPVSCTLATDRELYLLGDVELEQMKADFIQSLEEAA